MGGYGIIVIIFEVLYACFTIYFFVNMVKQLRKKKCKYFKDVWDMQEFATLVMSIIVIIMYILKKLFGAAAMHTLEESGSGKFTSTPDINPAEYESSWVIFYCPFFYRGICELCYHSNLG